MAQLEGVVALLLEGVLGLVMVLLVLFVVQEAEVEEPVQVLVLEAAQVVELVAGAGELVGVAARALIQVLRLCLLCGGFLLRRSAGGIFVCWCW